jgi:hypothetical protein
VWDPDPGVGTERIFPPGAWEAINHTEVAQPEQVTFAVDVNADQTHASIAIASAGGSAGMLVDKSGAGRRPGVGWVVDELARIAKGATVAVSSTGPAKSLIIPLEQAGVKVLPITSSDMQAACSWLFTQVVERKIVVQRHPDLDAAVASAEKRPIGDGFVWDRRSGDICALVALTEAAWAAQSAPAGKPLFIY